MGKVEQAHERLSQEEIGRVKELLWVEGMTQRQVCKVFQEEFDRRIDQATVSRIKNGQLGASVPWPDGTRHEYSKPSKKAVTWSKDAIQYGQWPEALQERMLQVVNAERLETGLPEVPPIAPQYEAWLSATAEAVQGLDLQNAAVTAEDSRRSLIMREFRDIALKTQEEMRNLSREVVLEETAEVRKDVPLKMEDGTTNGLSYNKVEWGDVLARWGKEPVVVAAKMRKDALLAEALCILCHEFKGAIETVFLREVATRLRQKLAEDEKVVKRVKATSPFVQSLNTTGKETK